VVRDWLEAHAGASERTTQILATLWASAEPQVWSPARGHQQGADSFWLDPQCMARVSAEDFDLARHHHSTALATGSGRGQAHSLQLGTQAMVLRHYRRGGLVAKISHDLFWRTAVHESRAMREFMLLRLMRSWQLPVPLAVAARHHGRGLFYQADILIGLIPDTLNLAQCLVQRPVQQAEWEAIGRAIRRMHDHQVFHSDLNIHNLLLDTQGRALARSGKRRTWPACSALCARKLRACRLFLAQRLTGMVCCRATKPARLPSPPNQGRLDPTL
jgi:3-deoxy-D-manno-octulosonic-acid transferase